MEIGYLIYRVYFKENYKLKNEDYIFTDISYLDGSKM